MDKKDLEQEKINKNVELAKSWGKEWLDTRFRVKYKNGKVFVQVPGKFFNWVTIKTF
jgi:hypothetical protein